MKPNTISLLTEELMMEDKISRSISKAREDADYTMMKYAEVTYQLCTQFDPFDAIMAGFVFVYSAAFQGMVKEEREKQKKEPMRILYQE